MLKHIVAIILFSIVVVLCMPYAQEALQSLVSAHDWVSNVLTQVFSGGTAGNITRGLLALLTAPVMIGLIPAIIYWIARRGWFPWFMQVVWVVWLVQTAALVILYKAPAAT
jgi:hypothetical protein